MSNHRDTSDCEGDMDDKIFEMNMHKRSLMRKAKQREIKATEQVNVAKQCYAKNEEEKGDLAVISSDKAKQESIYYTKQYYAVDGVVSSLERTLQAAEIGRTMMDISATLSTTHSSARATQINKEMGTFERNMERAADVSDKISSTMTSDKISSKSAPADSRMNQAQIELKKSIIADVATDVDASLMPEFAKISANNPHSSIKGNGLDDDDIETQNLNKRLEALKG